MLGNCNECGADVQIRPFPYPFASALSIVSDVDGASKARYEGYVGQIVRKHGLDFGDSTWLRMSCETVAAGIPISHGLGFFSRYFGFGGDDVERTFVRTRTFFESLGEYHLGNLDHFHAFVNRGPRVAVLEGGTVTAQGVEFELTDFETAGFWRCGDIYIEMVCVVMRGENAPDVADIVVAESNGRLTRYGRAVSGPAAEPGETVLCFVPDAGVDDNPAHPLLPQIARVSVEFSEAGAASRIARVLLASSPASILFDRIRVLRERFNVETPLMVEHGGQHLRSIWMRQRRDGEQDQYIANNPGRIAAFNGAHSSEKDGLVFSTDADDPRSVARVLPELSADFEVRFVVPQAATSNTGWSAEKMVQPFESRAGTVVYQVHRTLPNLTEPVGKALFDGTQSLSENFPTRLDRVLDASSANPGLYWPIYTHLGGIGVQIADANLPSPYFQGDALHRLQDRTFNISGNVAPNGRIWTVRASTLYDYALIHRSIPDHATWTDANTVRIASWHDPVLNKTLPRSPAQLYGLTFYVADPARAKVLLDGEPIRLLARNQADETGRPSVTICEAEIRHLVFDALDPLQKAGLEAQLAGGNWRFTRAEKQAPAFGRLSVSRGQSASLQIPMYGWSAVGSQLLRVIGRRSKSGSMGLVLETVSGGKFFFGDRALLDTIEPVTAHYIFEHDRGTGLRNIAAPFHCMRWAQGSATGGPLPSHALASITLHCAGGRGAYADFGDLALLRPRATSLNHGEAPSYCLGGVVPEFKPEQGVWAQAKGKSGAVSTTVDQRGWFCFPQLPEGIYNVWTEGEGGKIYDRRGPLVELRGDVMNLELSRKSSDRSSA